MATSKFEQALTKTINNEVSMTENGAYAFATTGKKLLDLHFATSSLRNKTDSEIEQMFETALLETPLLAVKWLFMARDIREGMGERRTFRVCLKWLATSRPALVKKLIPLVAEYGRYDDLFCLIGTSLEQDVVDLVDEQISADYKEALADSNKMSLLGKWMPSANTSSADTRKLAKFFCEKLSLPEKKYRKMLSLIRSKLRVIEVDTSAGKWDKINYSAVPSKANLKYKNAFLKHDEARRREFLGKLEKGEVKINSGANFPCDIYHSYGCGYGIDAALEGMWKALPQFAIDGDMIAVVDGSGSMCCSVGTGSLRAFDVANSLGIYCAEHMTGPFKDKFITFSSKPKYVDLSKAKSLYEKIQTIERYNECANTNVEATLDLVLKTAKDNALKQEDIPALLILSDGEFDAMTDFPSACDSQSNSYWSYWNRGPNYNAKRLALFENIRKKWENAGYKLPRIVFWNICGRTGGIPLQENDLGVVLTSGFSVNTMQMVMSNKTDPFEVLVDQLNVKRYDAVEAAAKDLV